MPCSVWDRSPRRLAGLPRSSGLEAQGVCALHNPAHTPSQNVGEMLHSQGQPLVGYSLFEVTAFTQHTHLRRDPASAFWNPKHMLRPATPSLSVIPFDHFLMLPQLQTATNPNIHSLTSRVSPDAQHRNHWTRLATEHSRCGQSKVRC